MDYDHKIFISVIVPIYNVETYIRDCLNSLASQTQPFKEIILVNDGSEDGSVKICEEYCRHYKNMILINQENQGLSAARNTGLKYAKGNYIVFIDSDDYVTEDMHESIHEVLLKNDLDILYYNADVLDELNSGYAEKLVRSEFLNNRIMTGIQFLEESFPDDYRTSSCLAVYNKKMLMEHHILFPYGLYYEDNIFFIQTVLNAKRILCVPNCFYIRRLRQGSIMTGSLNVNKCLSHIAVNMLIWQELDNYEFKNMYKNFYRKYISVRMIETLCFLKQFLGNEDVKKEMLVMLRAYMKKWASLYNQGDLSWEDIYSLRMITNSLYDLQDHNCEEWSKGMHLDHIADIMMRRRLSQLPLNDAAKEVGIYGIGKHTQSMLELYQRYVGAIKCKLFFVVTEKKQDSFLDRRVTSCSEIPENAIIIISSQIYQNEMVNLLLEKGIKEERIIILYDADSNYRCDMVLIAEADKEHYKKEEQWL